MRIRTAIAAAALILPVMVGAAAAAPAATTAPAIETVKIGTDATWTTEDDQPAAVVSCFNWFGSHASIVAAGANWIWDGTCHDFGAPDFSTHTFTKTFDLGVVESGTLSFATDNFGTASVNGVQVASSGTWETLTTKDITGALKTGSNTVSITTSNAGGPGALIALLDITHAPLTAPATKDECKDGGWGSFNNPSFSNQGQCVSFVATGGK